jgi:hypothetical protein
MATEAATRVPGVFHLPPNTAFGVTGMANSSSPGTVEVFVDDVSKAKFTVQGVQDGNVQNVVLNSGNGKVSVTVTAGGKPAKLLSGHYDLAAKLNFFLVGSEWGTDNDYNDAVVILNWPLG